jgi:hypothetical protein
MSVRFKPEVRLGYLDARLADVLQACCTWSTQMRIEIEINSINDGPGVHMKGSLHYVNLAIDIDTVGDKPDDLAALAEFLRQWMAPQYDVLFEGTHVHVEWDAHRAALLKIPS